MVRDMGIIVFAPLTGSAIAARLVATSASIIAISVGGSSSSDLASSSGSYAVLIRCLVATTADTADGVAVGAHESAFATTFIEPGRYDMLNSYSCKVSDHLCKLPPKFGWVISHFRLPATSLVLHQANTQPHLTGISN
ncbi:unnamed protein product [Phytophthora fragariaefolia]|uniref:Unnamed protein product n=1 Tax=Phytophthora fragariaefolia TaxID=1490495 RepID=A0A9W6XFB4_9STRA|nr:unnamed protein product [Phytophthora fragariaefolia]